MDASFPAHRFKDPALLDNALTHRSAARRHNERLEFLGDAVLGFTIADILFTRFPDLDEGVLTRARASLVNRSSLAALARDAGLGEQLTLGEGERRSGGRQRDSILANAVEAVLGAVYLDGGIEACRAEIEALYEARLQRFTPDEVRKDPKTELQELLQAKREPLPNYETVAMTGTSPDQVFDVVCHVSLLPEPVAGSGRSRRIAEQRSARAALAQLGVTARNESFDDE